MAEATTKDMSDAQRRRARAEERRRKVLASGRDRLARITGERVSPNAAAEEGGEASASAQERQDRSQHTSVPPPRVPQSVERSPPTVKRRLPRQSKSDGDSTPTIPPPTSTPIPERPVAREVRPSWSGRACAMRRVALCCLAFAYILAVTRFIGEGDGGAWDAKLARSAVAWFVTFEVRTPTTHKSHHHPMRSMD